MSERFRPLFFPEWGYVLIVLGALLLLDAASGRILRHMRIDGQVPQGPVRILLALAALGGILAGAGLVLESAIIAYIGAGVFVLLGFATLGVIKWSPLSDHRESDQENGG